MGFNKSRELMPAALLAGPVGKESRDGQAPSRRSTRPGGRRKLGLPDEMLATTEAPPEPDGQIAAPGAARRAAWAARLEHWTDRPLTMLAALLVPLLLAPFVFGLSAQADADLRDVAYGVWGVFAVVLAMGLIVSPDRRGYLRRHWLDLLVVAVPLLGPFRTARTIQLFWAIAAAGRVLEGNRRLVARRGTGFLLLGVSLVVATAAGLIVSVERDDPSAKIRSYGDGLWWAITTFATVGYGDKYPVTSAGRGIAVALMLLGIAAFGVVTARLAALFVEEQEDDAKANLNRMDERLRRIESALLRPPSERTALAMLRRRARGGPNARQRFRRRGKRREHREAPSKEPGNGTGKSRNGRPSPAVASQDLVPTRGEAR